MQMIYHSKVVGRIGNPTLCPAQVKIEGKRCQEQLKEKQITKLRASAPAGKPEEKDSAHQEHARRHNVVFAETELNTSTTRTLAHCKSY